MGDKEDEEGGGEGVIIAGDGLLELPPLLPCGTLGVREGAAPLWASAPPAEFFLAPEALRMILRTGPPLFLGAPFFVVEPLGSEPSGCMFSTTP